MNRTHARLVAAATVTTLGAGVALVPALGIGATTTRTAANAVSTAAAGTTGANSMANARADHEARRAEFEKALAAELGIDVAKLRAAQSAAEEKVFVANLDEAVASGRLTEAEATTLREAAAAGNLRAAVREMAFAKLKTRLDADVAAKRITRVEADRILADARRRSADDDHLGLGFGRGPGVGGPHGGMGRGPGGHGPGGFRP